MIYLNHGATFISDDLVQWFLDPGGATCYGASPAANTPTEKVFSNHRSLPKKSTIELSFFLAGFSGCWKCCSSCTPWGSVSSATKWTWRWANPSTYFKCLCKTHCASCFRWRTNLLPRGTTPTSRSSSWETTSGTFLTRILVECSTPTQWILIFIFCICIRHRTNMKTALRDCCSCCSSSQQCPWR